MSAHDPTRPLPSVNGWITSMLRVRRPRPGSTGGRSTRSVKIDEVVHQIRHQQMVGRNVRGALAASASDPPSQFVRRAGMPPRVSPFDRDRRPMRSAVRFEAAIGLGDRRPTDAASTQPGDHPHVGRRHPEQPSSPRPPARTAASSSLVRGDVLDLRGGDRLAVAASTPEIAARLKLATVSSCAIGRCRRADDDERFVLQMRRTGRDVRRDHRRVLAEHPVGAGVARGASAGAVHISGFPLGRRPVAHEPAYLLRRD